MRLVLASASPRRAELLRSAGFTFEIMTTDVDESRQPAEGPEAYVTRLAETKARAVASKGEGQAVLGADTIVVCDEAILGKPVDGDDAKRMLRMLSGRTHRVMTGVCLLAAGCSSAVAATTVEFAPLSAAEIDWYVASGEPADKAGAYAVQGLASRFVTRIEGSYSNVVGLPVSVVYQLCTRAGILVS